ncbi:MAG: YhdH/YhfP family quinone oxidoreductase [Planctomycetales bacterium]|nr:YhdH/YhfP family quinone oxidoreductase [Planctomycetales bacterium]
MAKDVRCYLVSRNSDGEVRGNITTIDKSELPDGDIDISVKYSSLNYKDALAAKGHPGVAKSLPHVPGIDAAGVVTVSQDPRVQPGQEVIVTGYELGAGRWGGWSEMIRVPSDWVVPLPEGLSLRSSMILGTAGFTAAQCVREILRNDLKPDAGPIVVTGATGGVGCLAVAILAQLGFDVVASTGKKEACDWLLSLGAKEVISREAALNDRKRPLASVSYQGAVDTVGGETLASILRAIDVNGCVAACGLVGGTDLPTTVYPFILRGVRLAGITSALCPMAERLSIWDKLAGDWSVKQLEDVVTEIPLDRISESVDEIYAGSVRGRVLVAVS